MIHCLPIFNKDQIYTHTIEEWLRHSNSLGCNSLNHEMDCIYVLRQIIIHQRDRIETLLDKPFYPDASLT